MQVHGIGGTVGVLYYSLMASPNYVYELYGKSPINQSIEFTVRGREPDVPDVPHWTSWLESTGVTSSTFLPT